MDEKKQSSIETLEFINDNLRVAQHEFVKIKNLINELTEQQNARKIKIRGLRERLDYELAKLSQLSKSN